MKITNRKAASKRKKIFFMGGVVIAIAVLILFLLNHIIWAIIGIGVFSIWYLFFLVADYHSIEFLDENDKIILRYYKTISLGGRNFNSIEIPQNILKQAIFENSIFGKLTDLTFIVKTKRGIAEYPSVSLSAVPLKDRIRIQESLNNILRI
jgi:hypothetical protein